MALYRSPEYHSTQGEYDLEEHFCEIILKLGPWPRRRCYLKNFFFFCSGCHFAERHHFSNFGRGSLKKHSCKIISKSINRFRRRCPLSKLLTDT